MGTQAKMAVQGGKKKKKNEVANTLTNTLFFLLHLYMKKKTKELSGGQNKETGFLSEQVQQNTTKITQQGLFWLMAAQHWQLPVDC